MLKELAPVFLIGAALELLWIGSYTLGPLRENTGPFLILMLAAFGLCLWAFSRLPISSLPVLVAVLAFALLFRVTLLPAPPYQSEDVYRYLWDARISAAGRDPFELPPESPALHGFRDSTLFPQLNSKPYITAYPPLSQILFRVSYEFFGTNVTAMKAVFSLLDFSTLLVALALLREFGQRLETLYLMAWNPFFIFEFSHSGHSESAMMFLGLLSVYLLRRSRNAWGMISYAGAVLVKLHPALWFPLHLRRAGWRAAVAGMGAGAVLASLYFTPSTGTHYLNTLRLYYRLFEFNAGIHYLLRFLGNALYHESWDQRTGPYLATALLAICIFIWWKFPVRDERELLHAAFWLMTADLCLSTTVHPWYLSWAAMALPFFPYAFMFYWTSASVLSYLAYAYRPVYEHPWVLLVEYLPMYALMAWEIKRGRPLLSTWLERRKR